MGISKVEPTELLVADTGIAMLTGAVGRSATSQAGGKQALPFAQLFYLQQGHGMMTIWLTEGLENSLDLYF